MSLPWQEMIYQERVYEKHLERMLSKYKDVDKAELEAVLLTEKELEERE
mgnify:CR=1 FL=1